MCIIVSSIKYVSSIDVTSLAIVSEYVNIIR